MTPRDYDAAVAEAQLDILQFATRNVPPTVMAEYLRTTLDPETLGGAVRSIAQLQAWMGAVLHGLGNLR